MRIRTRPSLAFVGSVGLGALLLVMTTGAQASTGPSVTGGGHGFLANGDQIDVSLTARTLPTSTTQGQFSITHHTADGGLFAHLAGTIDCLAVSANHAVATGVIISGFDGFGVDPIGHHVSIAVNDLGSTAADVVKLDLEFVPGQEKTIAPCQAPQLLTFSMQAGNFTVGQ